MEAAGVTGEGLLLRPWREDDVSVMTELFDTDEMDRWTPLAHPFTTRWRGATWLQLSGP